MYKVESTISRYVVNINVPEITEYVDVDSVHNAQ